MQLVADLSPTCRPPVRHQLAIRRLQVANDLHCIYMFFKRSLEVLQKSFASRTTCVVHSCLMSVTPSHTRPTNHLRPPTTVEHHQSFRSRTTVVRWSEAFYNSLQGVGDCFWSWIGFRACTKSFLRLMFANGRQWFLIGL